MSVAGPVFRVALASHLDVGPELESGLLALPSAPPPSAVRTFPGETSIVNPACAGMPHTQHFDAAACLALAPD